MAAGPPKGSIGVGGLVDYDDGSDSDSSAGGQSPLLKPVTGDGNPNTSDETQEKSPGQLEADLRDAAVKMRQKRQREEEEEEEFAGLLVKPKKEDAASSPNKSTTADHSPNKPVIHIQTGKGQGGVGLEDGDEKRVDTPIVGKEKEGGKKIRLNLGGLFKQAGSEGEK